MLEAQQLTRRAFECVQAPFCPTAQRRREGAKKMTRKDATAPQSILSTWWQLSFGRQGNCWLAVSKSPLHRLLACHQAPDLCFRRSRRFARAHLFSVFAFDDDYSFGVLQSQPIGYGSSPSASKLKIGFPLHARIRLRHVPVADKSRATVRSRLTRVSRGRRAQVRRVRARRLPQNERRSARPLSHPRIARRESAQRRPRRPGRRRPRRLRLHRQERFARPTPRAQPGSRRQD